MHVLPMTLSDIDRQNGRIQAKLFSANEVVCTFGGMIEEQISGLAVHFRYLARVLDAYGKCYLKTDHCVRQLQLSDSGVSGRILPKRNIAPRSHSVCN